MRPLDRNGVQLNRDESLNDMVKVIDGAQIEPPQPQSAVSSEAAYYEDLFIRNPEWNGANPNADEQARWECIKFFLDRYFEAGPDKFLLDVGCGRGWLTNLLSAYGTAIGVEPVGPVVEHAPRLFPALRFETTVPADLAPERRFDAILSSEVIEHLIDKHA